jgi:hypothetical protein
MRNAPTASSALNLHLIISGGNFLIDPTTDLQQAIQNFFDMVGWVMVGVRSRSVAGARRRKRNWSSLERHMIRVFHSPTYFVEVVRKGLFSAFLIPLSANH